MPKMVFGFKPSRDTLRALGATLLINCAACGKPCEERKRGWYCAPCDAYTETDVEVEE